jgi:hypothetical protein
MPMQHEWAKYQYIQQELIDYFASEQFQVLHTILETTQGREPKCVMPRIEETINYFRDNLSTALTSLEKDQ